MNKLVETEFLFSKIKRLYKNFKLPDQIDIEAWQCVLRGFSQTDILNALKNYRANEEYNCAPNPGMFKKYLQALQADQLGQESEINRCIAVLQRENVKKGDKNPLPIQNLIIGRCIFRSYGKEVLGYRRTEDTGYDNGTVPDYVKNQLFTEERRYD